MSADAAAEQDDYNREIGAKTAKDMDSWLKSLQEVRMYVCVVFTYSTAIVS